MCTTIGCVQCLRKPESHPKLELQTVVRCCVGTGMLCKNGKCSLSPSHHSSPCNDPSQCCATSQPVCSPKQLCTRDGFHSIASFFRSVSYMTNRPWKRLEPTYNPSHLVFLTSPFSPKIPSIRKKIQSIQCERDSFNMARKWFAFRTRT